METFGDNNTGIVFLHCHWRRLRAKSRLLRSARGRRLVARRCRSAEDDQKAPEMYLRCRFARNPVFSAVFECAKPHLWRRLWHGIPSPARRRLVARRRSSAARRRTSVVKRLETRFLSFCAKSCLQRLPFKGCTSPVTSSAQHL